METQKEIEKIAQDFEYTNGTYGFIEGAEWMRQRSYSEEEVKQIIDKTLIEYSDFVLADIPHWFKQFKNK